MKVGSKKKKKYEIEFDLYMSENTVKRIYKATSKDAAKKQFRREWDKRYKILFISEAKQ